LVVPPDVEKLFIHMDEQLLVDDGEQYLLNTRRGRLDVVALLLVILVPQSPPAAAYWCDATNASPVVHWQNGLLVGPPLNELPPHISTTNGPPVYVKLVVLNSTLPELPEVYE
jgi:hypothetical protein